MSGESTNTALHALEQTYEIIRELGRGGTALVYLARDRASGSEVAIKLIRAKYVEDEETLARFAREARYVGELHHPNVVAVRSVVELGELGLALVMDHVAGRTLKQTIQETGPFSPERAESVLRDIGGALGAAHAKGIVHRDVKPENIFIDHEGRALLADFGVARSMTNDTQLTMSGIAIGTPAYMAPEQIDGVPLDGRGDIYSLGLVGWEMLTGKRPWDGSSLYAVIYQQKHEELPDVRDLRPDVPDRLADVIAGAIEKDRAARWQNAGEFIGALDGTVTRHAPRPRPMLIADQTRRFVRPATPPDGGEAVLAEVALQPSLGAIAATEFPARGRLVTKRWFAIAAAAMVLALASFGIVLSTSQARTRVADRSDGEVAIGLHNAAATDPAAVSQTDTSFETVVGSPDNVVLNDAPKAETLHVITPPPGVAPGPREAPAALSLAVRGAEPATPVAGPEAASRGTRTPPSAVQASSAGVAAVPRGAATIAAGGAHTCRIMASGRVFCWGGNDRGQLGSGGTTRLPSPGAVATEVRFSSIVSGLSHSCGLARSGGAWCWGENDRGQLGDRSFTGRVAPVPVAGGHAFVLLVAGAARTCGLDAEGKAWCWGAGTRGPTGTGGGGSNDSAAPVAVPADHRFVHLAAGWASSCAIDGAGAAMCWGENANGQLGDGTRDDRLTPATVRGDLRFTAITAGSQHACGVISTGDAYCWGRNTRGQLGDGTRTDQAVPVRVKTGTRFVAISAGAVHTCALTGDGTAFCWGQNAYGQLGDGGTGDRTQPVAVAGEHAFASLRAFGSHTCGATASGEAFCWGYNLDGQLGDGTRVHRTRPVYVQQPTGS